MSGGSDNPVVRAFTEARDWALRAHSEQLIDAEMLARFSQVESAVPSDLFLGGGPRPLVVGLFGGTGVGKSSMLNRFAGETVARTGVERPTSREVTLYLHTGVALADLPGSLPLDRLQVRRHKNAKWRDVLWLDAPDIDSVEGRNREAALAWLPHIDLLLYVVSPERYRDDAGWRVLAARGGRHAWMFVMNRADESDPAQREDFGRMLAETGFTEPMLFSTSCAEAQSVREAAGDQLAALESAIEDLLRDHGVAELQKLGEAARLDALATLLREASGAVGNTEQWAALRVRWTKEWQVCAADLRAGLDWPIRAISERFAARSYDLKARLLTRAAKVAVPAAAGKAMAGLEQAADEVLGEAAIDAAVSTDTRVSGSGLRSGDPSAVADTTEVVEPLWDEWARRRLETTIDTTELVARRGGLPAESVRAGLESAAEAAPAAVRGRAQETLRAALASPGNLLRRAARRTARFLSGALPAAALAWVGYTVVRGYSEAAAGAAPYLTSDFAVHSVLMVAVAWSFPYALDRLLRPAMEEVAAKALRRGLAEGVEDLGRELQRGFEGTENQAAELAGAAVELALRIDPGAVGSHAKGALARVVSRA